MWELRETLGTSYSMKHLVRSIEDGWKEILSQIFFFVNIVYGIVSSQSHLSLPQKFLFIIKPLPENHFHEGWKTMTPNLDKNLKREVQKWIVEEYFQKNNQRKDNGCTLDIEVTGYPF